MSTWIPVLHKSGGRARRLCGGNRKSTRLNSSHSQISYAVFCLKKKKKKTTLQHIVKGTNCLEDSRTLRQSMVVPGRDHMTLATATYSARHAPCIEARD